MTNEDTKTPTYEQRAFEAFKKQRGLLTETPSELPEVYRGWWIDFQDGYLAAAKAEQKEIISEEKIMELFEWIASHSTMTHLEARSIAINCNLKIRKILETGRKRRNDLPI